ncbi:uncharacterized protein [Dysidea avara]|uniref:uncharacterized protein n=1 Tax=Dysidea avara TaxID=196820 RepID=UPI00332E3E2B
MIRFFVLIAVSCFCSQSCATEINPPNPTCDKIDECSCKLKDGLNSGVINLHPLMNGDHAPRFVFHDHTQSNFNFYYNPCVDFTLPNNQKYDRDNNCKGVAMCQTLQTAFNLGTIDSAEFVYGNGSVIVVYKSGGSKYESRTSEVQLVCDADEKLGRFEFVDENPTRFYHFKLYTECACPGKCSKPVKKECVMKDLCSCEMSDGSGIINLHSLDVTNRNLMDVTEPMQDSLSSSETYFYNPCFAILHPDCDGNSVCAEYGDSKIGLGFSNSPRFVTDGDSVSIQYSNVQTGKFSTVRLNCDRGARNKPYFRFEGSKENEYFMSLDSVCACPGECGTPALTLIRRCSQIDMCSCKVRETGQIISLHELDNPSAPLKTIGTDGYTYYYNPCSGVQLHTEGGDCVGVSACKEDLYYDYASFTTLGGVSSTFISYDNITMIQWRKWSRLL